MLGDDSEENVEGAGKGPGWQGGLVDLSGRKKQEKVADIAGSLVSWNMKKMQIHIYLWLMMFK